MQREFSRALKRSGIRVALDTGFNRSITQVILDRLGWSQSRLIDATICSDEVRRGRPHPDMIQALMARLGVGDARRWRRLEIRRPTYRKVRARVAGSLSA